MCEISITSCFSSGSGQEPLFSQGRGTGVPIHNGLGSAGEHGNKSETGFHRAGELCFGLDQSSGQRSVFILSELVPAFKVAAWKYQPEIQEYGSVLHHLCGVTLRSKLLSHMTLTRLLSYLQSVPESKDSYLASHSCMVIPT